MNYILLIMSCLCNATKSIFAKKSNECIDDNHNIYTYNFYMFFVAFLVSLTLNIRGIFNLSLYTFLMACGYGVIVVFAQIFLIKAMEVGSVSISSLFYAFGFLIPMSASAILYDEALTLLQIIGVVLIIISIIINLEKNNKAGGKWFAYIFLAFICNGSVGLIQKIFGMSEYRYEQSALLTIAFFIGSVVTFALMPKCRKLPSAKFFKTVAGSGLSLGMVNSLNVYISGVLPGVIVFPFVNGGAIVASSILARIILKEKIPFRKKISIAIGIVAICLLSF